MIDLDSELRLYGVLALNIAVIFFAWRLGRRLRGGDTIAVAADCLLIWLVVQYVSVCAAGLTHNPNGLGIGIAALAACAAIGWIAWKLPKPPHAQDQLPALLIGCAGLIIGYVGSFLWFERETPPALTDALVYHLPAAAQWLQTGRMGIFSTWFFNPANTYSPLGGSVFIEWWMAALHNDVLARFAQAPAILLAWISLIQLMRIGGVNRNLSCLMATAAVLARPLFCETAAPKDDLLMTAFFLSALATLLGSDHSSRWRALRLGISVGLMLAMKYTAILSLIPLVLAGDLAWCRRWRWPQLVKVTTPIGLLAGPWYLRNWIATGNPIFPMRLAVGAWTLFRGPLTVARSQSLVNGGDAFRVIVTSYFGLQTIPAILLSCLVVLGMVFNARQIFKTPLFRVLVLGGISCLLLFIYASPYPEVRFIYPTFMLFFVLAAIGLHLIGRASLVIAAGLLMVCILTDFEWRLIAIFIKLVVGGTIFAALVTAVTLLRQRLPIARRTQYSVLLSAIFAIIVIAMIWMDWRAFLHRYRATCDSEGALGAEELAWADYPNLAPAWQVVRHLSDQKPIAYCGTGLVYPLMGFNYERRIVYCPPQVQVASIAELPRMRRLSGEEIGPALRQIAANRNEADFAIWKERLAAAGAGYLLVINDETPVLIEESWARSDPRHFTEVFRSEDAGKGVCLFRFIP